jgi:hypothetical protein
VLLFISAQIGRLSITSEKKGEGIQRDFGTFTIRYGNIGERKS